MGYSVHPAFCTNARPRDAALYFNADGMLREIDTADGYASCIDHDVAALAARQLSTYRRELYAGFSPPMRPGLLALAFAYAEAIVIDSDRPIRLWQARRERYNRWAKRRS